MSIHNVPGSRAPRVGPSPAVPAAVATPEQSFARRLAHRRDRVGHAASSKSARGAPSARAAPALARSVPGKPPASADAGRSTARASTGQAAAPTRAVALNHPQMLTALPQLVHRITPELMRAIMSRDAAARGKPWRKSRGCVRVTVTIEGLGDVTIALRETPDGWAVEVQTDPLVGCLKQI